jgi:hypothetical protein
MITYDIDLMYYDGVEVWCGYDHNDHSVVGSRFNDDDEYLVSFVTKEELKDFKSGYLNIRELILKNSAKEWQVCTLPEKTSAEVVFVKYIEPSELDAILPGEAYISAAQRRHALENPK